jgi:hypothetical protein
MHKSAPPELIRNDYHEVSAKAKLRCELHVADLLLVQAIQGHAITGAGAFQGHRFVDTTPEDVVDALNLDPVRTKRARQQLIDEIAEYARRVMAGERPNRLLTPSGQPILGMGLFRWLDVEPEGVLRGLYLGGLRDSPEVRRATQQRYGIEIGYGECHFVDTRVMRAMGLDGERLARSSNEDLMPEYRRHGLIVNGSGQQIGDAGPIRYMYVRQRTGPGASDDCAILAGGYLYGFSVGVGVFLADAIDTLEKYTPNYGDQDDILSQEIRSGFPGLGLSDEDVYRLTYLASTPPDLEGRLPDRSLRHFLQVDATVDQTIIESHFLSMLGQQPAPMRPSHGEMSNAEVYDYLRARIADLPKDAAP